MFSLTDSSGPESRTHRHYLSGGEPCKVFGRNTAGTRMIAPETARGMTLQGSTARNIFACVYGIPALKSRLGCLVMTIKDIYRQTRE